MAPTAPAPVTIAPTPAPSTSSVPKKSFYETISEKPAQAYDSDEEAHQAALGLFSEKKQQKKKNVAAKKPKEVVREKTPPAQKQPPKEVPLIPGQKMALKRTILPSGERVEGEKVSVLY